MYLNKSNFIIFISIYLSGYLKIYSYGMGSFVKLLKMLLIVFFASFMQNFIKF